MYCPNCGNKNSEKQRFCRSCGLGLEKVAQSLTEQLPTALDESLLERKERLERWGVALLSVFVLGILGFVLYNAIYKLMISQGRLLAGLALLGGLVMIGSGLLSVILFAKATELKEASAKRQIDEPPLAETTGKLLDAHSEPAFGITDRTTELLPVKQRNKAGGE